MTKIVVFLNGPPGAGKDTVALAWAKSTPASLLKFAQPTRNAAFATFPHISEDCYEQLKSRPLFPYSPITLRDWMISFSEHHMKPLLGKDIFGRLLLEQLKKQPQPVAFITDGGFMEEIVYIAGNVPPQHQVILVRLHREGALFTHDSRSYLYPPPNVNTTCYDLYNNGTVEEAVSRLTEIINKHSI